MKIKCPACSKVLSIPESAAGKVVKCPCGKQLRAPGAAATPAGAKPAATPKAAPQSVAAQPASGLGGFDAAMFDELTDQDLKPMSSSAQRAAPTAGAAKNTAKLLQQHASPQRANLKAAFHVGPIASPWNRLAAAFIDGLVIWFLAAIVMIPAFFILSPMFLDMKALQNAQNLGQAEQQAVAQKAFSGFIQLYSIILPLGYALPIILFAWMVTKSGQTPGKKLCKLRIVKSDNKELPGFVHGVVLRSWVINVAYIIPFLALVDYLMIFGERRQCLHDMLAGTIVVDT